MIQKLSGNYRKVTEAVVIAAGLYVLLRLFLYITDPPFVLPAIVVIFILYCVFVYPRADLCLDRKLTCDSGDELKKSGESADKNKTAFYHTGKWNLLYFLSVTVLTFLVLHFLVLYMHEFSHSFAAYFLGAKGDPADIIWGINIFGSHCDENVNYDALFMAGKGSTAAAIAFAGPFSNIVLFIVTVALLTLGWVKKRPFVYHTIFWASCTTFIMVFEYVFTRSFMTGDDLGNIVHGLGISPYLIFIPGMILGLAGFWYILTVMVPQHFNIVTPSEISKQYVTITSVSFVFFVFYLGMRILDYPEVPQWWCGWVGILALFTVPLLVSPLRKWVRKKTGN